MPSLMPPYIHPADPAAQFARGFQEGGQLSVESARLGQANQAMQQRAAIAQMEMDAKLKIAEQQNLMEQHRIAIENQYKQSQIGLAQQRIAEASKMNEFRINEAANRFQATEAYKRDYQDLIGQGVSEDEASMKAALKNPRMFATSAGLPAAARALHATVPPGIGAEVTGTMIRDPNTGKPIPGMFALPGAAGQPIAHTITPKKESAGALDTIRVRSAQSKIAKMEETIDRFQWAEGSKERDAMEAKIRSEKRAINEVYVKNGQKPPYPEVDQEQEWKTSGGIKYRVKAR